MKMWVPGDPPNSDKTNLLPGTESEGAQSVSDFSPWSTKPLPPGELGCGPVVNVPPGNMSGSNLVRAYPPTEVEKFLVCPTLWWLEKKRGWALRPARWEPNRAVGIAVHTGLSAFYLGAEAGAVVDIACKSLQAQYVEQEAWTLAGLEGLVRRGLRLGMGSSQLEGTQVVASEPFIYGRKPDLILRTPEGLLVDENKVVFDLRADYIPRRLAEYDHSWQLRDYAYHVQEFYGEPVVAVRVQLIILGPRGQAIVHRVLVSPSLLQDWHRSAEEVWILMARMENGLLHPWQNLKACTNASLHYGHRCPLYEGCHVFHRDEEQFSVLYNQRESSRGA